MSAPPRILVVEDDRAIRESVTSALERAGYLAVGVADGHEATSVAASFVPDLAVIDIDLGDGPDGLVVARRINDARRTPFLFLTAADSLDDRLAGFERGADDYVTKPFAVDELLARVRVVLRHTGRERSATWQVADLVVDEAARTVRRGDVRIDLTRTEFDLLNALGRSPGTVFSKHQLMAAVWGYESFDDNLVDTYVSRLRKKLDPHGPRLVHTARGMGFSLRS